MYIIFNQDGSIKESQLNDYINQYSDGVNYVDIAIDGMTYDKFTASVVYTFSNGETATDSATKNVAIATSSGTYKGWRFVLHSAYTQYDGNLLASYVGTSSSGAQLFSYPAHFTVNFTSSSKQTELTWEEYKSLKASMSDYQLQYSLTNVMGYFAPAPAKADLENFAEYQLVITPDSTNSVGRSYELYYVDQANGGRTLTNLAIGLQGNKDYFLWKKDLGEKSDVQNVFSGFVSQYEDADGNQVNFGTDEVTSGKGFYVNVLDKSNNYTGTISLGAKNYKFAYDSAVDVFSSDGNTTAIKSPMGNASVELTNADGKVYGTNVYIGSRGDESGSAYQGTIKIGSSVLLESGGAVITLSPIGSMNVRGTGLNVYCMACFNYVPPSCSVAPTGDDSLTNKSYVDKTADSKAAEYASIEQSRAQEKETDLQSQINAINASQNFVATVATYADLANINPNFIEKNVDCVLVLKDENHNYQAYVYKYIGSATGAYDSWFEPVGELGDYYTKAEIQEQHNQMTAQANLRFATIDSEIKETNTAVSANKLTFDRFVENYELTKEAYEARIPTFYETSSETDESDVIPVMIGLFGATDDETQLSE